MTTAPGWLILEGGPGCPEDITFPSVMRLPANNAPLGGLNVVTEKGRFAARSSGTEDIYKIYAERYIIAVHLLRLQEEAIVLVGEAFKAAGV